MVNKTVFIFLLSFILGACFLSACFAEYNLATKKDETIFFSTEREVRLGRSIAKRVEEEFEVCSDEKVQERVDRIGARIVSVCERKDVSYCFTVLEEGEEVNAFALPGGYVYINKAVLDKASSDDEIAACLGHEVGHIVARHSVKRLQAGIGYSLMSVLAAVAVKDASLKKGADIAFSQIMLGYSREDEFLADKLAVRYMREAGYNPDAVVSFLEKIQQIEKEAPLKPLIPRYARTHPYLPERIAAVKQEVYGRMDFDSYINKGK